MLTFERIFSGEFNASTFTFNKWLGDGEYYTNLEPGGYAMNVVRYNTLTNERSVLVNGDNLIPEGSEDPLSYNDYSWSNDGQIMLMFTNTRRVWRTNTKGDYYIYNLQTDRMRQIGKGRPASSLMFAKFSPDDRQIAYASGGNLFVENVETGEQRQLTEDGNGDVFNGTFDWVYEEEFACRDGFRWSPDGRYLAFWQVDASKIRDFLMINNIDSTYSYTIPVQYPKVGEAPSKVRVGVVDLKNGQTRWLQIPIGDDWPYLPRMNWLEDSGKILVQQLNRKQNSNRLWLCDPADGSTRNVYTESDACWVDVTHPDPTMSWDMTDPHVLDGGKAILWTSEKDGWRHFYRLSMKDGSDQLLTKGDYDIARMYLVDEASQSIYFNASLDNPTQRYLYSLPLKGSDQPQRLTPADQPGLHQYDIAPNGRYAIHTWSNLNTAPTVEMISLPDHKRLRVLVDNSNVQQLYDQLKRSKAEFFKITTEDSVEMDGYIRKPWNFDPSKKYPVLFYVYGEPWGQTATDSWDGQLFHELMAQKGYLVITMDNRGTPALKGREWRKSLYRKIGIVNSRDQAMATKEILKWPYVDANRIAVWGWSGGGSMTLNLLFRYPDLYGTGVSVAPVADQLLYDNVYQERYMGVPWENKQDFIDGSPITHAHKLEGNLMLVHGTGDDNVHYQNSEALIDVLISEGKQFSMMAYPNRSHSIYEGRGTRPHLYRLIMNYITQNTPPGGRAAGKTSKP